MADFTAVIRRAVEGLPEQSPELRARVYDKARSAVIRQMENMNPPPPEALIKRQIDKIDAAIAEVESDFAVALPPEDEVPPEAERAIAEEYPAGPEQAEHPEADHAGHDAPRYDNAEHADQEEAEDEVPSYDEVHRAPVSHEAEAPLPEPEPEVDEEKPRSPAFLQGATFEAVNHPDRVVYESEPEPEEEATYAFDRPDDAEDGDAGSVVVEPDEDERKPADDWHYEAEPAVATFEQASASATRSVSEKDWAHVDSLLGLEPESDDDDDDDRPAGPRSHGGYEPDTGRGGGAKRIVIAAAAVVILVIAAAAGYFVWSGDRTGDDVDVAQSETPAENTAPQQTSPDSTATADTEENEGTGEKRFTQRLLPDGTEVDEGLPAAGASSGPARTVANQTSGATAAAGAGQETSTPAPPVGAAQKMYLYEEQLGQSVPSAYEGTVTWELKQENNGTAVSEPVIEGVMNVPDAGLSGVITFRRNDDSSLPASHLIDIAFTLDDSFEGGAIDNVQRISLKNTEASRGDPLIAVSAKITDDLYMLALNDFEQARGQNLALLAERNWIDIPVTYRNGRRALLTLEKGTTGMAIFDRAVQEWQALGDIGDNN